MIFKFSYKGDRKVCDGRFFWLNFSKENIVEENKIVLLKKFQANNLCKELSGHKGH